MFKNMFRNRRRSKNEPFVDENEPIPRIRSRGKISLPVGTSSDVGNLLSFQGKDVERNEQAIQMRSTENIPLSADVRSKPFDAEYISRAASSSQVTDRGQKYNNGRPTNRRRRLSSVVSKILTTHSESKQTPRTHRMLPADLRNPGLWTDEESTQKKGIKTSDTHYKEEADIVFAVPQSCQSCASTTLQGDTSKNRSEGSWICSQCTMQMVKARDRRESTKSSPAALSSQTIDSNSAGNSAQLCQPVGKLPSGVSLPQVSVDSSSKKYSGNCGPHCSHDCSCSRHQEAVHSRQFYEKDTCYSTVSDHKTTSYLRNVSHLPSPLRVSDLECSVDDDIIPVLVEISPRSADRDHYKQHSSPVQPAVETEGKSVNESEMYILTDSFLDDSSFFMQSHTAPVQDCAQSTTVVQCPAEVTVADDYDLMCPGEINISNRNKMNNTSAEPVWLPVVSPQFTSCTEVVDTCHIVGKVETPYEQLWCRKSLSEWTTDDVLQWVLSVGLVQFYDTFRGRLLVLQSLSQTLHVLIIVALC